MASNEEKHNWNLGNHYYYSGNDFGTSFNGRNGSQHYFDLMSAWVNKLITENDLEISGKKFIGDIFIKQFKENAFSKVFASLENLKKPLTEIYNLLEAEYDQTRCSSTFISTDYECIECNEKETRIKELEKVEQKLKDQLTYHSNFNDACKHYLDKNLPNLIKYCIEIAGIEVKNKPDPSNFIPNKCQEQFLECNEKLMKIIYDATNKLLDTSLKTAMIDLEIEYKQNINKLNNAIIMYQQRIVILESEKFKTEKILPNSNFKLTETEIIKETDTKKWIKYKKYQRKVIDLKKEIETLKNIIDNSKNEFNMHLAMDKINKAIQFGDIKLMFQAKNRFPMQDKNQMGDCPGLLNV